YREPRGRPRVDRCAEAAPACKDRCDRWRDAATDVAGMAARRTARLLDGGATVPRAGGPPAYLPRTRRARTGKGPAHQSHQGSAFWPGHHGLSAVAWGSAGAARRDQDRRRTTI